MPNLQGNSGGGRPTRGRGASCVVQLAASANIALANNDPVAIIDVVRHQSPASLVSGLVFYSRSSEKHQAPVLWSHLPSGFNTFRITAKGCTLMYDIGP